MTVSYRKQADGTGWVVTEVVWRATSPRGGDCHDVFEEPAAHADLYTIYGQAPGGDDVFVAHYERDFNLTDCINVDGQNEQIPRKCFRVRIDYDAKLNNWPNDDNRAVVVRDGPDNCTL